MRASSRNKGYLKVDKLLETDNTTCMRPRRFYLTGEMTNRYQFIQGLLK